jgi:hypothetical protein
MIRHAPSSIGSATRPKPTCGVGRCTVCASSPWPWRRKPRACSACRARPPIGRIRASRRGDRLASFRRACSARLTRRACRRSWGRTCRTASTWSSAPSAVLLRVPGCGQRWRLERQDLRLLRWYRRVSTTAQAIVSFWNSSSLPGLTSDGKLWYGEAPNQPVTPYAVLIMVSEPETARTTAFAMFEGTYQINCMADDLADAEAMAETVWTTFNNAQLTRNGSRCCTASRACSTRRWARAGDRRQGLLGVVCRDSSPLHQMRC